MPVLDDKREEKACQEYVLNGGDKTKAYRAGFPQAKKWKDETVWSKASVLFKSNKVLARVAELEVEVSAIAEKEFKIDANYVLGRLIEIDQMDVLEILEDDGSAKPISKWPKVWRQFISGMDLTELYTGAGDDRAMIGFLKKMKWPDKVKNLELLGKHVQVQAFKERVEVAEVKPIELMTDDELDAELNRRLANERAIAVD